VICQNFKIIKGVVCWYCLRMPARNLSSCFIMQFYGIMNACTSEGLSSTATAPSVYRTTVGQPKRFLQPCYEENICQ